MTQPLNALINKVIIAGLLIVTIISVAVSFGWLFDQTQLLNIIPGTATMKFNTALLFFLCAASAWLTILKNKPTHFFNIIAVIVIAVISSLNLTENLLDLDFKIDNLFIVDQLSEVNPGRMSSATAFCFLCMALGLVGINSESNTIKIITQYILLLTTAIALISFITFVLKVPVKNKTGFWDTMAINTTVLFFIISIVVSLKNYKVGFTGLLIGKNMGSSSLQYLLPFIITVPLVFSVALLYMTNNQIINFDFGIAIYTSSLIIIIVVYVSFVAFKLKSSDIKSRMLSQSLTLSNNELVYMNLALDATSIVMTTDQNGKISYINDNFCKLLHYEHDKLIGKNITTINSVYHDQEFFDVLFKTISEGRIWKGEIRNKDFNNADYWLSTTIVPFKNHEGNIYKYLTISHDISDRAENQQQLSNSINQLKIKNKELEQFAYIASHDLQEPLRTVTSFVGFVNEEYESQFDDRMKEYLQFITSATERMKDLISGLLEYSRIGLNKKIELIDCNELVRDVIKDLGTAVNNANTKFEISTLPVINGYDLEIRLLFQNLISNAIKFRKKEGDNIIQISSEETDEFIQFKVQDNGIGIDEKYRKKIFLIFQRLHDKSEYLGAGIGLAHCSKIVALHGGEIWVDPVLEQGSTFSFTVKKKFE